MLDDGLVEDAIVLGLVGFLAFFGLAALVVLLAAL